MEVFATLFHSKIGLLSLFTIAFIVGMALFIFFWVKKQMAKDAENRIKKS